MATSPQTKLTDLWEGVRVINSTGIIRIKKTANNLPTLSVTLTLLLIPGTGNNPAMAVAEPQTSSQKTEMQKWIVSRLLQECSLAGGSQTKKA